MVKVTEPILSLELFKSISPNLSLKLTLPKYEGQVFKSERDWEGQFTTYYSLLTEGKTVFMYYRAIPRFITRDIPQLYYNQFTGLLINQNNGQGEFRRYDFNKVNYKGQTDNNLLLHGDMCHNFSAFSDPKKINGTPYKAIARNGASKGRTYIELYESTDKVTWTLVQTILTEKDTFKDFRPYGAYDALNNIVYDRFRDLYHIFLRHNSAPSIRLIQKSTSPDLINWEPFTQVKVNNQNIYNIYNPSVSMYPDSPYFISFPNFQNGNNHNSKTVYCCFSRDGINWTKHSTEPWIGKTRSKPPQSSVIGIIQDDEHNKYIVMIENFLLCECHQYSVQKDRFGYITDITDVIDVTDVTGTTDVKGVTDLDNNISEDRVSTMTTKPLRLNSAEIGVNCTVFQDGCFWIELCNQAGDILAISDKITTGDYSNHGLNLNFDQHYEFNNAQVDYYLAIKMRNCNLYALYLDRANIE